MNKPDPTTSPPPSVADWTARALFFVLIAMTMVALPMAPANELDPSWRMVLSYCFKNGLQFGTDVVFTYGPLGFLMGKTYSGLHYTSLLIWQGLQAVVFTLLIFRQGLRLQGYTRYAYFAFFFLLGISYEDGLQQLVIALVGFELLRRCDEDRRLLPALLGILLGVLGLFKFTNLMMGGVFISCTIGLLLWRRRNSAAVWLASWFAGSFLLGWLLCGQNPLNLPAYFYNSWEISQGYQETMGIPTPESGLIIGLITLALIGVYVANFVRGLPDRPRAVATTLALAAYVFLNWKHGFIRADGHMIGFFFAVLLPATAFPALLDDGIRFRKWQSLLLIALVVSSIAGAGAALPHLLRGILSNTQERLYTNVSQLLDPAAMLTRYQKLLEAERTYFDMPQTRGVIGNSTIDVLGYEQAAVIYNQFNYHPRPVFQSYSAYRPHLSRLNAKFYASNRAPEYVLLKLQSIDRRLMVFDDSEVLSLLVQRYEFVHTERGYQLWRRKPGDFSLADIAPRPLRTATLVPGQPFLAEDFSDKSLWATVDIRPSLLGRLRALFYKLPIVILRIENTHNMITEYRMPLPQGRTGFIINPVVEDLMSYMQFSGGKADRLLRSLTLVIAPEDRPYFKDEYTVTISSVPPSTAGREFYRQSDKRLFLMFDVVPMTYEVKAPLSEGTIDGRPVMVFHAPSEMTLHVPRGSTKCTGAFGFLEGAYTDGNITDGADFYITWVLGTEEIILLERSLDPVNKMSDRGLQFFQVTLPNRDGGHLRLRISPGPKNNFAWDWTAWSALNVH
ncbi:MAG: hypothetical protein Q8J74_04560 [Candidatus Didemnitutus sp.]|nr:hypothetical protein [Candidatus Didemnitutus sp.]